MVLSVLVYALMNLAKFIKDIRPKLNIKDFKGCFIPIIGAFALHIAAKINASLDIVMLGCIIDDTAVGLFVSATKVINIVVDILLVINTVLLPRIANYISSGKIDDAKLLLKKSFSLVFALVVPITIGLSFLSKEIILLLSGQMYTEAINTMTIICITVFPVVFANFLGIQVLYAFGHTKSTTISIAIGDLFNLIFNFIFIPKFSHFGAGITTIISNIIILIIQAILVVKYCRFNVINKENIKVLIASSILFLLLVILQIFKVFESNSILSLLIKILSGSIIYLIMLVVLRHEYVWQGIKLIYSKLKRNKKWDDCVE